MAGLAIDGEVDQWIGWSEGAVREVKVWDFE